MTTHFINGQQVREPKGWADLAVELERDDKDRIIGVKVPLTVTFTDGTYAMLRQMFEDDLCDIVPYQARELCGDVSLPVIQGSIILADAEWNLSKCEAECTLVDDSIYARLRNNWRIPITPQATQSKNGEPIVAVPPIAIEVFDPTDPEPDYLLVSRAMYDWRACMEHAIAFCSDGLIPIVSDWYAALPDNERWAIVQGFQLRTGSTNPAQLQPTYNLQDLWTEVAKMYNLYMGVSRDVNGNPIVRIEEDAYWFGGTVLRDYPNQPDLVQSVDRSRLFSKVDIGSDEAFSNRSGFNASLPFTGLGTFYTEEYGFDGTCNQDEVLDLTAKWVRCSNRIERAAVGNDAEKDDSIFLVQYTESTLQATKGDYFTEGDPWLYNEAGLNINVLNRHNLPGNVGVALEADTAQFLAERTAAVTNPSWTNLVTTGATEPGGFALAETFQFDDDFNTPNFDTGLNYGGTTVQGNPVSALDSFYTAPAIGWYVFNVRIPWEVTGGDFDAVDALGNSGTCSPRPRQVVTFNRYTAINSLLQTQTAFGQIATSNGSFVDEFAFGVFMDAGQRVRAFVRSQDLGRQQACAVPYSVTVQRQPGATFGTSFTPLGGGRITSINPDAARIITHNFERHMTAADWTRIVNDPRPAFRVAPDQLSFRAGHFTKISRRMADGRTTFDLISPRTTT